MKTLLAAVVAIPAFVLLNGWWFVTGQSGLTQSHFPQGLVLIELERGGSTLRLTRNSADAWIVDPPRDLADQEAAQELAKGLSRLMLGKDVAEAEEAKAYGLGPADALRVSARAAGGETHILRLGRRALGDSLYALDPGGRGVRLARGPDPALLARGRDEWLEARLLPRGGPEGALVWAPGAARRRLPPDDPLCRLKASGFDPSAASVFGGFESPHLTVTADGAGRFRIGARLSRSERAAKVDGRDLMLRVPWAD